LRQKIKSHFSVSDDKNKLNNDLDIRYDKGKESQISYLTSQIYYKANN